MSPTVSIAPWMPIMAASASQGAPPAGISNHAMARDAIYRVLESLELKAGEEALLPVIICDSVLHPFHRRGIPVAFYGLRPDLSVDFESLHKSRSSRSRILLTVNYFGFQAADPEELLGFSSKNGLHLIEDCAHSWPFERRGDSVGEIGHSVIYSPRKFLGCREGGILYKRGGEACKPQSRPSLGAGNALATVLKASLGKFPGLNSIFPTPLDIEAEGKPAVYRPDPTYDFTRPPTRWDAWLFRQVDEASSRERRRSNFQALTDMFIGRQGFAPLRTFLPDGMTPFGFPVVCDDRSSLYRALLRNGVHAEPTLPQPFYDFPTLRDPAARFPAEETLASRLLCLPVHPSANSRYLDSVREALT